MNAPGPIHLQRKYQFSVHPKYYCLWSIASQQKQNNRNLELKRTVVHITSQPKHWNGVNYWFRISLHVQNHIAGKKRQADSIQLVQGGPQCTVTKTKMAAAVLQSHCNGTILIFAHILGTLWFGSQVAMTCHSKKNYIELNLQLINAIELTYLFTLCICLYPNISTIFSLSHLKISVWWPLLERC